MANGYIDKFRNLTSAIGEPIDWNAQARIVSANNIPTPSGNIRGVPPSGNIRGLPPRQAQVEQTAVVQRPSGNVADTSTPTPTPSYSSQINTLTNQLGEAVQGFGKPYDLSKDPVYEALAKYQQSQMLQMAGSRGMAMSENTKGRIAQNNMLLGQQFQQQDQLRQLQNIQNLQGQLGTMTGLEDRATQNQFTLEDRQFQQEDRSMNLEDRRLVRDQTIYGIALTPQTRDYMNTMKGLTPEKAQYLSQYSDNFAAEINNLPEGDPNRKLLEAGRFQKVIGDPTQYREYLINDYGLSPFQVDNIVTAKKIEELKAQATNDKEAFELQKLMLQVEKAGVDLSRSEIDTQKADIDRQRAGVGLAKDEIESQKAYYDTLMAQIKAANLPAQMKADLENTVARTRSTNVATQLSQQKINEATKNSSPAVKNGFGELVSYIRNGGDVSSWLNSTKIFDEEMGREIKVTGFYKPDELTGILKLAKDSQLLTSKSQISEITELVKSLKE